MSLIGQGIRVSDQPTDTGTLSTLVGVAGSFGHEGAAISRTTTSAIGFYSVPYHGGGTITNSYGILLAPPNVNGATVTNYYGVYQADANAKNYFNGKVGIGTTSPASKLEVNGAARNTSSILNRTTTIDFSTSNLQYTTANCTTFALHNLKDGGSYTFAVKGTTQALCAFNGFSDAGTTPLTVHLPFDHGDTASGKHTLYTFMVIGTDVYVSWQPGY